MKSYRWGILGPGVIANKFTAGLKKVPGAVLYAAASRDITRAEDFARKNGYERAYGSYQELASDPLVDIVYVATPHTHHEAAAALCLNHGKAVICEKPFAVNARQTERLLQCARKNKVFLMEAMWTRFLPNILKFRELLAAGAIGNVRLVYADFGFRTEFNPEGRLFSPALAGGSLLDVGIYNLSFCSMIFGKQPDSVQSRMAIGRSGVDEETSVLFGYDEGQSAMLYSAIRVSSQQGAAIIGDAGRIEFPFYWRGKSFKLYNGDGVQEFDQPYEATGYQFEAEEVMRCLDKGLTESPLMPLDESLAIMKTCDRVREAGKLRYPCDDE